MEPKFFRLVIVFIAFFTIFNIISCSSKHIKLIPEHTGIDPKIQPYVNEFKELAKIQNIEFKNNVTIGFKNINHELAVGETTYGWGWREIDIDTNYWHYATPTQKMVLTFHEFTHAYCQRKHDFANGINYPKTSEDRLKDKMEGKNNLLKYGLYEDLCPLSLMYPSVLDDYCVLIHYNDYIREMFNRCVPW